MMLITFVSILVLVFLLVIAGILVVLVHTVRALSERLVELADRDPGRAAKTLADPDPLIEEPAAYRGYAAGSTDGDGWLTVWGSGLRGVESLIFPTRELADPDPLIEEPAAYRGDTVKDWLQHYTHNRQSWGDAVAEFYRRAAADPEIADYFRNVDMERLQRHFTAAMIMVTGKGLRASTVERMHMVHSHIRNSHDEPITEDIYHRVITTLVTILAEWQVPEDAINDLARIIGPLRSAVVVEQPESNWPYDTEPA